ncbi:hypothetical protein [Bacillus sp. FJAT-45350]
MRARVQYNRDDRSIDIEK